MTLGQQGDDAQIISATGKGRAKQEPPHRKIESDSELTADKTPKDAPWWYHLAINAGGITIISALFIWQTLRIPTPELIQENAARLTERLIDRTLSGLDKVVEKQDKVAERNAAAATELRGIIWDKQKNESQRHEKSIKAMEDATDAISKMTEESREFHKRAEVNQKSLSEFLKKLAKE